jgi:GNAT superfamily N-acetyltransferase
VAKYRITEDKTMLSVDVIKNFLNNHSYWGKNRTREQIISAIENSMCFGMFVNNSQIGFARVVTDYTTMYYLADVFVVPEHQRKGYGRKLIEHIVEHPKLKKLLGILFTQSAHNLYEEYGFSSRDKRIAERVMIKYI